MKPTFLLVFGLAAFPALLTFAAEPATTDRERLQGTWKVVSAECNHGEKKDMERNIGRMIVFTGDKVIQGKKGDEDYSEGQVKLDESTSPKQIEYSQPDKDTFQGIYAFDGDTLKLSFLEPKANKRPTTFELKEGDKQFLLVLKREPEKSK